MNMKYLDLHCRKDDCYRGDLIGQLHNGFIMKLFAFVAFATISPKAVFAFAPTQWGHRASFLNMNVEKLDTKTIRVGVIGAGRIGVVHLEAITKAPGVIPVIISNPTISKAEKGEQRDFNMA